MSADDFKKRIEDLLGMGPIPPDTPAEEVLCWLEAKRDDIQAKEAQEWRDRGEIPLCDVKLFIHVLKVYKENTIGLAEAMEILRKKKRRGHVQQKALEIWDAHYKGREVWLELPSGN